LDYVDAKVTYLVMAQRFGAWSVSYNKWSGPLETRAAELPIGEDRVRRWFAVERAGELDYNLSNFLTLACVECGM
jgi:hypothetical protein